MKTQRAIIMDVMEIVEQEACSGVTIEINNGMDEKNENRMILTAAPPVAIKKLVEKGYYLDFHDGKIFVWGF